MEQQLFGWNFTLQHLLHFIAISYCLCINSLRFCYKEAWVTFAIGICIKKKWENHVKLCCYSVTMMITIFVRLEFNRIMQKELIDTNFVNFGGGLVFAILRYNKTCNNAYISCGNNGSFIFSCWKHKKPFSSILLSNGIKSS